ncbi:MAG: hypothetical protein JW720_10735, partial [Sedimentisphaerales bacterium]|nr:hypothetical protein [Sedimentisphaerales bacterium]
KRRGNLFRHSILRASKAPVRLVIDDDGDVVRQYTYEPFGQVIESSAAPQATSNKRRATISYRPFTFHPLCNTLCSYDRPESKTLQAPCMLANRMTINCTIFLAFAILLPAVPGDANPDFLRAKTIFQTNTACDGRLAIAVDAVILHRHGADFAAQLKSWRDAGFTVGRMFFADSDAANEYWTGKWDATPHGDDVERDSQGNIVKCAGVRPYMLPTEGWIRYLEEMTRKSIDAGAQAILPEEPLAHVFTGYEKSFRLLWQDRYKTPWQGQHESAKARFLTAQLKNELYIELERRLLEQTRKSAASQGRKVPFILPIHSLYSNIAAQLVAPLGTSTAVPGIDGYIGQIWTGPVNWALGSYDSPRKSFFTSAYVLYDYFTQLTVASSRKLWLLVDPVEDDPNHKWAEFAQWYKHCIAAMLLSRDVDSYEIMPWPDRIFLPGYGTGGKTPAPEDYRITILAVTQALQEIPAGGKYLTQKPQGRTEDDAVTGGIGIAIADTLMWQKLEHPRLQGVYSLLLPLVERGIPVSSCLLERLGDDAYMSRFDVIVLSYESFKPLESSMNVALADWVRAGGSLVCLGGCGDDLDLSKGLWWRDLGFESPLNHLLGLLNSNPKADAEWKFAKGAVIRNHISPKAFADPAKADEIYLPLLETALRHAGSQPLKTPGSFCMKRGPFIVAHAETAPLQISGRLIDIFDPNLPLLAGVELQPGQSGLYRDVEDIIARAAPAVLHATHRLGAQEYENGALTFTIRGPKGTPAVARVFLPDSDEPKVTVTNAEGWNTTPTVEKHRDTIRIQLANSPAGATVKVE